MNILYFTSFFSYTVKMSVQGLMACAGTLLIVQSFMATLADASDCIVFSQNRVFDGWSCQPFSHRDIIHVPYHHCSLACIQNQACQAFIYNKEGRLCMMLNKHCVWTQPHVGHIYGISKQQCFSWEHHDKDYPFYRYYEGARQSFIGRRLHRGDMLVGKITAAFHTVDPLAISLLSGGSYETLVVEPSCQVRWVPHNANSGQSLPYDALIGGVLSTTNTPLYVARQLLGGTYMVGYYNPLHNQAWSPNVPAVLKSPVFEVMTVTRTWQYCLVNQ